MCSVERNPKHMMESLFPSKNVKSTHQTKRNHLCMNQIHSHSTNTKLGKEQMEYKETHFGGPKTSSLAPGCLLRRGKRKEKAGLLVSLNTFHWQDSYKHKSTGRSRRHCLWRGYVLDLEKWSWQTYLWGKNGDPDIKSGLVDTGEKGAGEQMEREALKHTHSTGSSAWCSAMTWRLRREGVCVYIQLIHDAA